MRLLAVGDSFGTLDPVHSHWLRLWAETHGGNTEHCAIKGGNHVNIASDFFHRYSQHRLREFNGLVYFVTDYLRSEAVSRKARDDGSDTRLEHPTVSRIKLSDVTDPLYVPRWRWMLSGEHDIPGSIQWPQTRNMRLVVPFRPDGEDEKENDLFYYNMSLRWLVRANFNSARSVVLAAQSAGLPVCMVRTTWNQGYLFLKEYMPDIATWIQPRKFTVTDPDISNHVNQDSAMEIAELWQRTAIDTGVFTPKTITTNPGAD